MKRTMKLRLATTALFAAWIFACSAGESPGGTSKSGDGDGDGAGAGSTSGGVSGDGDGDATGGVISGSAGGSLNSMGGDGPILVFPEGGAGPGWIYEPPGDLDFAYDPSLDSAPEECVALEIVPEVVELDMFVILDRSGSMDSPFAEDSGLGDCTISSANNGSRWCNAIHSIHGFVADPSSVNMGIAYSDFAFSPCSGADMELPLDLITEGDTNGQIAALVTALDAATPGSGTNTESAVNAIIQQTAAHVPLGVRRTIGIVVTDGEPYLQPDPPQFAWQTQACEVESATVSGHLGELNAKLQTHFAETGIPTFIMGMEGVDAGALELLAAGAGAAPHATHCIEGASCSYYSVGDGDPTVFKAALEEIRRSVVGCEFVIPNTQVGLADLGSLEVTFRPDSQEQAVILTKRPSEAACTTGSDYWVEVSGLSPVVHLCPAVCDLRGAEPSVGISISCEGT